MTAAIDALATMIAMLIWFAGAGVLVIAFVATIMALNEYCDWRDGRDKLNEERTSRTLARRPYPDGLYDIPVPAGWSAEQTWEAIRRCEPRPMVQCRPVTIEIENGRMVHLFVEELA